MPLEKSSSDAAVGHNIAEMEKAGHPHDQSVAAALRTQDEAKGSDGGQRKDYGFLSRLSAYLKARGRKDYGSDVPTVLDVGAQRAKTPQPGLRLPVVDSQAGVATRLGPATALPIGRKTEQALAARQPTGHLAKPGIQAAEEMEFPTGAFGHPEFEKSWEGEVLKHLGERMKRRDYAGFLGPSSGFIPKHYSKDASGHEHKGKGKGGGQFTAAHNIALAKAKAEEIKEPAGKRVRKAALATAGIGAVAGLIAYLLHRKSPEQPASEPATEFVPDGIPPSVWDEMVAKAQDSIQPVSIENAPFQADVAISKHVPFIRGNPKTQGLRHGLLGSNKEVADWFNAEMTRRGDPRRAARTLLDLIHYVKDQSGHEHRGKGEGGGQFSSQPSPATNIARKALAPVGFVAKEGAGMATRAAIKVGLLLGLVKMLRSPEGRAALGRVAGGALRVAGKVTASAPGEFGWAERATRPAGYARDKSGHEHRGKGKGGGQFVTVTEIKPEQEKPGEIEKTVGELGAHVRHGLLATAGAGVVALILKGIPWLVKKVAAARQGSILGDVGNMTFHQRSDYVKDKAGHEHKGKGKGGGQFTGSGEGGSPSNDAEPEKKAKSPPKRGLWEWMKKNPVKAKLGGVALMHGLLMLASKMGTGLWTGIYTGSYRRDSWAGGYEKPPPGGWADDPGYNPDAAKPGYMSPEQAEQLVRQHGGKEGSIKDALRRANFATHPDRGGNLADNQRLQDAHEALKKAGKLYARLLADLARYAKDASGHEHGEHGHFASAGQRAPSRPPEKAPDKAPGKSSGTRKLLKGLLALTAASGGLALLNKHAKKQGESGSGNEMGDKFLDANEKFWDKVGAGAKSAAAEFDPRNYEMPKRSLLSATDKAVAIGGHLAGAAGIYWLARKLKASKGIAGGLAAVPLAALGLAVHSVFRKPDQPPSGPTPNMLDAFARPLAALIHYARKKAAEKPKDNIEHSGQRVIDDNGRVHDNAGRFAPGGGSKGSGGGRRTRLEDERTFSGLAKTAAIKTTAAIGTTLGIALAATLGEHIRRKLNGQEGLFPDFFRHASNAAVNTAGGVPRTPEEIEEERRLKANAAIRKQAGKDAEMIPPPPTKQSVRDQLTEEERNILDAHKAAEGRRKTAEARDLGISRSMYDSLTPEQIAGLKKKRGEQSNQQREVSPQLYARVLNECLSLGMSHFHATNYAAEAEYQARTAVGGTLDISNPEVREATAQYLRSVGLAEERVQAELDALAR